MRAAAALCCAVALCCGSAAAKRGSASRVSGLAKASRAGVVATARALGAGPRDIVIFRNGNITGEREFILRDGDDETWDKFKQRQLKFYNLHGKLITRRADCVKARVVFTVAEEEKWIHPPIHVGFSRPMELPTPLGWSPAIATSEVSRCLDSPENWQGKGGESCDDYVSQRLCTLESGYGPGWVRMDDDVRQSSFLTHSPADASIDLSSVARLCSLRI